MRFVFAIITLVKGGAQRMLVEIMEGLARRGHDVSVVMPASGIIDFPLSVRVLRTPNDEISESDIPHADVLVSNFYTTVGPVQAASERGKGAHVRLSLCYEPLFLPNQAVSFPSYQVTPNLVVLSKYQQELVYLNHGIEPKRIPIGVSGVFRPLGLRQGEARPQIGAVIRRPDGGDAWHRQQEQLVAELLFVKANRPEAELHLIGPPRDIQTSPVLMQMMTSGQFRFHMPENDEELCRLYNRLHIFAASSVHEACPFPPLEAMKCGTAVAAVYSGGNMDYCRHEYNCLLSYGYERRLGANILRLIDDLPLRERLAAAGMKEAEKWTWERSVLMFEQAACEYMGRV